MPPPMHGCSPSQSAMKPTSSDNKKHRAVQQNCLFWLSLCYSTVHHPAVSCIAQIHVANQTPRASPGRRFFSLAPNNSPRRRQCCHFVSSVNRTEARLLFSHSPSLCAIHSLTLYGHMLQHLFFKGAPLLL